MQHHVESGEISGFQRSHFPRAAESHRLVDVRGIGLARLDEAHRLAHRRAEDAVHDEPRLVAPHQHWLLADLPDESGRPLDARVARLLSAHHFHQDQLRDGSINLLLTGILYANAITTVSPTYAREIQTPEHGVGLDSFLRQRASILFGVLNGIDESEWSPDRDEKIPHRYSAEDLSGKELDNGGTRRPRRAP